MFTTENYKSVRAELNAGYEFWTNDDFKSSHDCLVRAAKILAECGIECDAVDTLINYGVYPSQIDYLSSALHEALPIPMKKDETMHNTLHLGAERYCTESFLKARIEYAKTVLRHCRMEELEAGSEYWFEEVHNRIEDFDNYKESLVGLVPVISKDVAHYIELGIDSAQSYKTSMNDSDYTYNCSLCFRYAARLLLEHCGCTCTAVREISEGDFMPLAMPGLARFLRDAWKNGALAKRRNN